MKSNVTVPVGRSGIRHLLTKDGQWSGRDANEPALQWLRWPSHYDTAFSSTTVSRAYDSALTESATTVSPTCAGLRYTSVCRPAIWQEQQAEDAGASSEVFRSSCAGLLASFPLTRNVSMARGCDRGNTPEHLLKEKELLIELPMRRDEVHQHW